MHLTEILDQIPDYQDFMTVVELDNSTKKLANEFETVELHFLMNNYIT